MEVLLDMKCFHRKCASVIHLVANQMQIIVKVERESNMLNCGYCYKFLCLFIYYIDCKPTEQRAKQFDRNNKKKSVHHIRGKKVDSLRKLAIQKEVH